MKVLIGFAALLFFTCSNTDNLAGPGGSSETQNGFVCTAIFPDGNPAKNALVRIRPADYLAGTGNEFAIADDSSVIDTTTNDSGRITIHSLRFGEYFVEINDQDSSAGLMCFTADEESEMQSDTVMLQPYARAKGQIDSGNSNLKFVQIRGLERVSEISNDGYYFFDDLPQGTYTFRLIAEDPQNESYVFDSVNITNNSVNIIGYRSTRLIILNTTASGADVSQDVFSFPVLLRFNEDSFQFIQDTTICFTKPDGTELPHQIEYLDSQNSSAAVWVKVDTIKGDDTTRIYMHYERNRSAYCSNSDNVFDSKEFAGVWHLGEISGSEQGHYTDATANARNGTGINMETGIATPGIAGLGQELNGIDNLILIPGLLDQSKSLTLSAWVKSEDSTGEIISIGDNAGMKFAFDSTGFGIYCYYSYGDETSWLPIGVRIESIEHRWHHISVVIDSGAGMILLYIDGALMSEAEMIGELLYNKTGADTYIGQGFRETNNLQGMIDEVRVSNVVRSSAWVKLCYENQRMDQTLVTYHVPSGY